MGGGAGEELTDLGEVRSVAVRVADVGQPLVADRGPQPVQVPRDVHSGQMVQPLAVAAACRTKSTPDPPGPPGFTNSEPIRPRRVARRQPQLRQPDRAHRRPRVVLRHVDRRTLEPTATVRPRRCRRLEPPVRRVGQGEVR